MINQISEIIDRYRGEPGPLIVAEVHGVVSFYHFFRHHPPGTRRRIVREHGQIVRQLEREPV